MIVPWLAIGGDWRFLVCLSSHFSNCELSMSCSMTRRWVTTPGSSPPTADSQSQHLANHDPVIAVLSDPLEDVNMLQALDQR